MSGLGIVDTGKLSGEKPKHEYPSNYRPGAHWSIDAAWEILDWLPPGTLSIEQRSFLAGMIAGRLMRERTKTNIIAW